MAEEKQSGRDAERQKDEQTFRQKMAEEKQSGRDAERQKDEQSFKLKCADEKQKGRFKSTDSAFKRKQAFLESIRDGRTYICISCHRRLYKNGVHALISDWESELEDHHPGYKEKCIGPIIRTKMPHLHNSKSPDDQSSDFICFTCHTYMIKGKMAPMSNQNNLQLVDISNYPELKLKDVENQLLARNLIFQKIKLLPKSRWNAMIDKTVNVPIPEEEISNTIEQLPRTPKEAHVIPVQLKRKKGMKNTHKQEYVNCEKIIKCIERMKSMGNRFYQDVNASVEEYTKKCQEADDENFLYSSESEKDPSEENIHVEEVFSDMDSFGNEFFEP